MTKDEIKGRIEVLKHSLKQQESNYNCTIGAIQEQEATLRFIEEKEKKEAANEDCPSPNAA